MAWGALFIAGILEVIWVYAMKQSEGFSRLIPSVIVVVSVIGSFYCLSFAMRSIPISISYTVWVGFGAVGAFLLGVLLLGELLSWIRLLGVSLVIFGLLILSLAPQQ